MEISLPELPFFNKLSISLKKYPLPSLSFFLLSKFIPINSFLLSKKTKFPEKPFFTFAE
jgi:hypothetical protein